MLHIKRSINNVVFGFLSQIVTIILAVIIPRLFITNYGSVMNGFISSINQIFIYFGLFEAGVGTATLVALYGSVAKDDKQSINGILSATSIYYKRTGIIYFITMAVFAAIYPIIVPTDINTVTARVIIMLTGLVGVINYFFQGKFYLLLQAEGKNYIITNLRTMVNIVTCAVKIVLINNGFNVIAVESTYVVVNILQLIYIYYYIKHKYRWLDIKAKPNYEAIANKHNVLIHQVSTLIFSNTDIIVLTVFCNLKLVSVYTLYALLYGTINRIINTLSGGVTFILGQLFNEDRNRYIKMHDAYELIYMSLVFALYSIAFIFILPFLKIYTAGINDINYIDKNLSILFVCTFLLSSARATSSQAITYAGHFRETRWRSILESSINLSSSLLLVNYLGIYGVLIGTVIALVYRTNDLIIYANKYILKRSPWITYRRIIFDTVMFLLVVFISKQITMVLDSFLMIFWWAMLYCISIIPLFILSNLLLEKDTCKSIVKFIKPYIGRKITLS